MSSSSGSSNEASDNRLKRKAEYEAEKDAKKTRVTYDPLKVNPFEAMMSGNYSRRVFEPLEDIPQSPPSIQTSTTLSSSHNFLQPPSSPQTLNPTPLSTILLSPSDILSSSN